MPRDTPFGVLLITIFGCWVMRKIKARWPNISNLRLILFTYAFTFVLDFFIEACFMLPFGLYTYPGAIRSVSVIAGTYHQWPVYEGLMWGGVQAACAACVTSPTIVAAQSLSVDWTTSVAASPSSNSCVSWRSSPAISSCFFVCYNVPAQWIGMHADPWPADHLKRSYFNGGICGDGTDVPCPDPACRYPPNAPATSITRASWFFPGTRRFQRLFRSSKGIETLT